nr:RNA-directed DNA polymerase, eukaryota [Tanacetum cinerariifolium]
MGPDDWQEVSRKKRGHRSYEDDVVRISISVYVSNLPEVFSAKDLFRACSKYGHVVDSYIPHKRSKEAKRFGFVKFINVFSVERLVDNLNTSRVEKRQLWHYITNLISRFHGECLLMGDFNKVRSEEERMGSIFNSQGAAEFKDFISTAGLCEIQLEGYSFTWSHSSANKMSKLDRFIVSDGLLTLFPNISALCLDRHLSDHRPILLHEAWESLVLNDSNDMIRFNKNLQALKKIIRVWVADFKKLQSRQRSNITDKLREIDVQLD